MNLTLVPEPQREETELYLAVQGEGIVRCRRCRGQVDLAKTCELSRGSDGRIYITACSLCPEDPARPSIDRFVRGLVDQLGADIVLAALSDLPSVPAQGSTWIWRSLQTADVRSMTFDRVYGDARSLRFVDAGGAVWTCSLRDWCGFLKNGQAESRR